MANTNVALISFVLEYCPQCGAKQNADHDTRMCLMAGASARCKGCGFNWAVADEQDILNAGEAAGTDLKRMAT